MTPQVVLELGTHAEFIPHDRFTVRSFAGEEFPNVVTDRDTGRSRGFAFVEMSNTQEADRAIAGLNGTEFEGRALNVNEARPKGQGGGRGQGGGFGRQRREPRW